MIVAVAGGKGGVGTSTLAYNLGAAMDALVVDADLGMADLPRGHGPDLHDALAARAAPTEVVRGGPVDIVPCGRSLSGARAADLSRYESVLAPLDERHGDVLVDCPAGLRADVGVPLALADRAVLVATPSRNALAGVLRIRELARLFDASLAADVLNRAPDDPPTDAVERTLGTPTVPVPDEPAVGRSVRTERPVVATAPESTAAAAFRAVRDWIRADKGANVDSTADF